MKKCIFTLLFFSVNFLVPVPLSARQQSEHQKNFNNCLHGYGCDSSQLTESERTQVQQAAHQRNYNNCIHGYGCDPSQLTESERTQVQQAAHQRNYNNCIHGYGCDPSQLTESERTQVQQAAHQRNYNNCIHGYGCDPSQLTESEQTQVQQAAHQRNYNNCIHGYGCDPSQLTASEQASVAVNKRDNAAGEATAAPTTPPHFYINKDGERVQSPTYSKTVPPGATAQCRDGSYSFSRNHRGTCSHHGGVSRWLD